MTEIHSPRKIFKFEPKYYYENYDMDKTRYNKLIKTIKYMSNMVWKKLEYKYLDDDQYIEIHRWLGNNCYVEYRLLECEDITDLVGLDIFEDNSDTYQHLLVFNSNDITEDRYDKLVIGNDYFGMGYVYTPDFEWRLMDGCNYIDIEQGEISLEEVEHIRMDKPYNYDINKILVGIKDFVSVE
jgi:hypothetical protein